MTDLFKVEFTAKARTDLSAAKLWLMQPGSGRRSHGRYLAILKALEDLTISLHRWPTGDHVGFRKRALEDYRILYSIDGGRRMVTIRRILGPGQDLTAP